MSRLLSEDAILERVNQRFPQPRPPAPLGRGDDCAIVAGKGHICVSTDLFIEDVHFRRSYFSAQDAGHKALAVNLSDLAAMGAKPMGFQLGLALPDWVDMPWLDNFLAGMAKLAAAAGVDLSGGDLSAASALCAAITIYGEPPEGTAPLRRGGSMPGDKIFVVGRLGLARAGLRALEDMGREAIARWPAACNAHLRPMPQISSGLMLARAGSNARPPALMDVSDGLARDLPRLLGRQSGGAGLGARLELPQAILHPEAAALAEEHGLDPWLEAALGGEDYALLGSCAPDMLGPLKAAIPGFACVGEVDDSGKIFCNGRDLADFNGFDHFSGRN